jgi:hypothetical protein
MVLLVLVPGSVSLDNRLNRSILLCLFLLQDLYASTKFRLIWSEFWSIRISPNFFNPYTRRGIMVRPTTCFSLKAHEWKSNGENKLKRCSNAAERRRRPRGMDRRTLALLESSGHR